MELHEECLPVLLELRSAVLQGPRFCPHFVRWEADHQRHGRQGPVPTTPPRRKVMRGGKDRCGTERDGPERGRPGSPSRSGLHEGLIAPSVQSTAEGRGERRCSNSPLIIQ